MPQLQAQQSPLKRRKASPKAITSTATTLEKKTHCGCRLLGENNTANPVFSAKREIHLKKNCIIAYKYQQKKKEWVKDLKMQVYKLIAV